MHIASQRIISKQYLYNNNNTTKMLFQNSSSTSLYDAGLNQANTCT